LGRGTAARMVFARRTLVVLSVSTHMEIGDAYFDHVPAQRGSHLRWKAVCAVPAPVWPQFPEGHRNAHARATRTRARAARTHACTASSLRFADAGWPRQKRMPSVPD
jgi:hypothetical protein